MPQNTIDDCQILLFPKPKNQVMLLAISKYTYLNTYKN